MAPKVRTAASRPKDTALRLDNHVLACYLIWLSEVVLRKFQYITSSPISCHFKFSNYLNIYLSTLIPQLTNAANTADLYQMVGGQRAKASLEARGLLQGD